MSVRICLFGDSFVNGTGDDDGQGWVGRLCAAERRFGADLTCYNLGVRRDTSADVAGRWRREAEARLPLDCDGRLVFSFGVNDCALGPDNVTPRIAMEAALANARAILGEACAWLPTLMIGPLSATESAAHNERVVAHSEGLTHVCDAVGVPFFSTVAFAAEFHDLWRSEAARGDGVHPNSRSYAALAEVLRGWTDWREWFAS